MKTRKTILSIVGVVALGFGATTGTALAIASCSKKTPNSNEIIQYAINEVQIGGGVTTYLGSLYDMLEGALPLGPISVLPETKHAFLMNVTNILKMVSDDIGSFNSFNVKNQHYKYSDVVFKAFRENREKANQLIDKVKTEIDKDLIWLLIRFVAASASPSIDIDKLFLDRWHQDMDNPKFTADEFERNIKQLLSVQYLGTELVKIMNPAMNDTEALEKFYDDYMKPSWKTYIDYKISNDQLRDNPVYTGKLWETLKKGDIIVWPGSVGHVAMIDDPKCDIYKDNTGSPTDICRIIESAECGVQYGLIDDASINRNCVIFRLNKVNSQQIEKAVDWADNRRGDGYNIPIFLTQQSEEYPSGTPDSWYCSEFIRNAFWFSSNHKIDINNYNYFKSGHLTCQPGYTPTNLLEYKDKEVIYQHV